MKRILAHFSLILSGALIAILTVRETIVDTEFRYLYIASIMALASLVLAKTVSGSWLEPFSTLRRMDGRVGYRLCIWYFILTCTACMLVNPTTWQSIMQATIGAPLASNDAFLAVLVAPIVEEFLFRGTVQRQLTGFLSLRLPQNKAEHWATYLASLIFWLFHAPGSPTTWWQALQEGNIPLSTGPFFLGLICGFIVIKDKSIFMAVLFHALANLLAHAWNDVLPKTILPWFFA